MVGKEGEKAEGREEIQNSKFKILLNFGVDSVCESFFQSFNL
jgi:hypothetical protein